MQLQCSVHSELFRMFLNRTGSIFKLSINVVNNIENIIAPLILRSLILILFYIFSNLELRGIELLPPFIRRIKNSFNRFLPRSTRLNYFRIFLYFSVVRSNLSEYLCSEQVCSAIPRLRAWNSPSRRRYRAPTRFPTTIYDVMKRIRSASESFLPSAASSLARVPPTSRASLFLLLYLSDSLANHSRYPLTSTIYSSTLLFPLSTRQTFPRTKRTDPNFAIPRGFIYSSSKFRVFRVRFVGVLQFPSRLRPYEPVRQAVTNSNSYSCRFSPLSMQDILESFYAF